MRKLSVVVPVSGGKDSQACLKLAVNEYGSGRVLGLFCDTRFEHPLTYTHIDSMRRLYSVKIARICEGSVDDVVLQFNRFPSALSRACTKSLKIRPSKKAYKRIAEKLGAFEVWYGVRTGESTARRKRYEYARGDETYDPHDFMAEYPKYLGAMGVRFRLPIVDWSEEDVFAFIGDEANPLYSMGMNRVGCFPCLAAGNHTLDAAFSLDEFGSKQRRRVAELEKAIGKSVYTGKELCGAGCAVCSI